MIAVAVVAVLLWAGLLALEYEGLLVPHRVHGLASSGNLATCVSPRHRLSPNL